MVSGHDQPEEWVGIFAYLDALVLLGHRGTCAPAADPDGAGTLEGGVGRIRLLLADEVVVDHRRQDVVLPLLRGHQVDQRVVLGRRLRQAGEHSRLRKVQLAGRHVEVALRSRFDAIGLGAVEALVEVELEYLVLGICLAELVSQRELLDLAAVCLVRSKELLLRELLGDGAGATHDVTRPQVVVEGAKDRHRVETRVAVEVLVFDGDGRVDHVGVDVLEPDGQPMVTGVVAHVGQLVAVAIGDEGVARERSTVQAADRGKAVEERLGVSVARKAQHQNHGEKNS